jgi:hypothetical protein
VLGIVIGDEEVVAMATTMMVGASLLTEWATRMREWQPKE